MNNDLVLLHAPLTQKPARSSAQPSPRAHVLLPLVWGTGTLQQPAETGQAGSGRVRHQALISAAQVTVRVPRAKGKSGCAPRPL